ncbi:MAG: GNAT family N-acetyltransferase [Breznakibacter sp.]
MHNNRIHIRSYNRTDKPRVMGLLRLNTPMYFSPHEERDLVYYLDHEIEEYYVLEVDDEVVGCGGINYKENHTVAYISWDFLHPDWQRQGYGRMLLGFRLDKLNDDKTVAQIIVRTSQFVYRFYEKSGFRLVRRLDDYWAKGYDLYQMEYVKEYG